MFDQALSVLLVAAEAQAARLQADGCVCTAAAQAGAARDFDAVVFGAPDRAALVALRQRAELAQAAFDSAVLVHSPVQDLALELELLSLGVEAFVAAPADLVRALRHAVMRKRVERSARTAYATDLATGLPHQAQLIEHMTQLLALREREPAPMVLLVLRIEGYASAAARLGGEAANVLRRKVAVRLRAALRASDVVAAIGPDSFGILLGRLESRGDGERVAAKLVQSLRQPLLVAGQPCVVAASVGLALYPDHGKDARSLMQRASAQAGAVATVGGAGYAASVERASGGAAANDPD
ncbi:MAG: GGDEF domain-containing protein [Burkholderiales bacterium]|nr:GGDEF domain-containing protein [Burkholderiales bacterium]MDE2157802.1 GGDEF domain-containing protein [Burkholderiales bacterium]MDE2505231.1 GGDEF domain-containing protein [Burkholderiales bacterium]